MNIIPKVQNSVGEFEKLRLDDFFFPGYNENSKGLLKGIV